MPQLTAAQSCTVIHPRPSPSSGEGSRGLGPSQVSLQLVRQLESRLRTSVPRRRRACESELMACTPVHRRTLTHIHTHTAASPLPSNQLYIATHRDCRPGIVIPSRLQSRTACCSQGMCPGTVPVLVRVRVRTNGIRVDGAADASMRLAECFTQLGC